MYSLKTIGELKSELRRRNASTAGKKADLIERLEAYDRNQNFGNDYETEDDIYQSPASEKFKDINADSPLPNINKHEIQQYYERYNAKPCGQLLYESRHLITARFCTDSAYTYVRGECKASMKKVTYVGDVKLSKEGFIENSHCECAAGSGIHACCKHIAVLLCGINDIVHNKIIKLHQACTQKLMMFNRPKKVFYNSPIAAQNLPHKRQKKCNYDPLKEADVMENYSDYVHNLVIGYGESTMPILQTLQPANPHAIAWDHYPCLEKSPEDLLLEQLLLKNVTSAQIEEVERNTRAQASSLEWHERRSCRVTASMFYAVCHSKSYSKSLLNRILAPKVVHTRAVDHGKINEPIAIDQYMEKFGVTVDPCGIFISLEYPYLAASPDGLIGENTVVEVKCPYAARNSIINETTVPYLENRDGELCLKTNHPYYAQVQGQLHCTGKQYCNFIVYTYKDMKIVYVNKDDSFINEMLMSLINFYVHYLEPAILNKYIYKDYLDLIKKQK